MLTDELSLLALYGILLALTLLAQATGALGQFGLGYLMSSRDEHRSAAGVAARLERALANSITAMVLFAPAILLLHARGAFSPDTLIAAQIFLAARIVYLPAYAFGIVGLRSLAWTVGFFASITLYVLAL
ncbi:MAG: MAPEG family protein [Pseudomonadota bacterium]